VAQNRIGIGQRCVFSPHDGFLYGSFRSQPKWTRNTVTSPLPNGIWTTAGVLPALARIRALEGPGAASVEALSLRNRVSSNGNLLVAIEAHGAAFALNARQSSGQIPQAARRDKQLSALGRIRLQLVPDLRPSGKFPATISIG